jgi:hypothetical protein
MLILEMLCLEMELLKFYLLISVIYSMRLAKDYCDPFDYLT